MQLGEQLVEAARTVLCPSLAVCPVKLAEFGQVTVCVVADSVLEALTVVVRPIHAFGPGVPQVGALGVGTQAVDTAPSQRFDGLLWPSVTVTDTVCAEQWASGLR